MAEKGNTKDTRNKEKEGQLFVWQGYTGKVELISFKTFLTKQVRRVALGGEHSLFLTYDNYLYSCGSNEYGELGVPSFEGDYSFDPCHVETLTGKDIADIACGQNNCAAICDHGQLYCWGSSEHGQCGLGIECKKISTPERVKLITPASVCPHGVETLEKEHEAFQVSCGSTHSVAISTDGNVWVWGSGVQLGLGENRKALTPEMLEAFRDKSAIKAHCGDYHSVVIVENKDEDRKRSRSRDKPSRTSELSAPAVTGVRRSTASESPSHAVDRVESAKESITESLCSECSKIAEHDRDNVDSAIELQDNVFKTDSDNTSADKETVNARKDAEQAVAVIEDHFGDDTSNIVNDTSNTGDGSPNIVDDTSVKSVSDDTTNVKSTSDLTDTQTAAKSVEISEALMTEAKVDKTEVKSVENLEQSETAAKNTDGTQGEFRDETSNKTINVTSEMETAEASAVTEIVSPKPASSVAASLDPSSREADIGDPLGVTGDVKKPSTEFENKDSSSFEVVSLSEVQLRSQQELKPGEDPLTQSIKSTTSIGSTTSGKSRTRTFLNEAETREFLAKQFEDDDVGYVKGALQGHVSTSTPKKETKAHIEGVKQDLGSLTSFMTTSISTFTSKAIGNITSVFSMSDDPEAIAESNARGDKTESLRGSRETLKENIRDQKSDRVSDISAMSDRSDSPGLDESGQEMYALGDITTNVSLMSLPDAETSLQSEAASAEASPRKKRESGIDKETTVKKPVQGSPVAVSKQSQSLRTIEAKQEQLRKRSSNLPQAEEPARDQPARVSMETEIWAWGLNAKGQLGLGDMIERSEPACIQFLNGKRIIKIATGSQHTLALTATGHVYSWGLNISGQLGHGDLSSSPVLIPLNSECVIWDISAGSNHSIFLMDHADMKDSKPDVFYVGKHPCKDLYVPIYKTQRLTALKYIKKAGWVRSITTGGDNCSCLTRQDSTMTAAIFDMSQFLRKMYLQQQKIIHEFIKRLQLAGFFTSLDVAPYKGMMGNILTSFIKLTRKLGEASIEVTSLLREGESLISASFLTKYDSYIDQYKDYSLALSEMEAVGGFEFAAKTGSSTFDNLSEVSKKLLTDASMEGQLDHANRFRKIMNIPLSYLKDLSALISRFSDVYERDTPECNLLSSVHLNYEHLIRTSSTEVSNAENTRKFWETCTQKISENLRCTSRRLIKESKSCPITLASSGRFSSHNFYLFNDIFIHSHASSYTAYPLETVWVDTPTEGSGAQTSIVITTPEETFTLTAQTAALKVEWLMALNSAINKCLPSQKSLQHQTSSDRINPPVVRQASHTFTKHPLYKDAKVFGYWLNGKLHGGGKLSWPDGKKYSGRFKHGVQFGFGKLTLPVGDGKFEYHEGNWKDGKLHGHAKIRYGNGDLYDGYFKEGQRQGHGVYRKGRKLSSASYIYVGEWLNDKRHGYGVMDDILKGEKYMGMWQEDYRHGDGIVVTLDGMYFEGNFQYNKLTGFGLMLTDDHSCYEGEFSGITLLQGKGTLTFPSGDKLEGQFNGTWNQGLKITGTFIKNNMTTSVERKISRDSIKSSLYGKLCVRADRKWEEMFFQCCESLHYSGDGEPNTKKAWEQIAIIVTSCRNKLKDKANESLASKIRNQVSNLERLEKIPPYAVECLSIEHYAVIRDYVTMAFDTHYHPLGHLIDGLVDVFRAAYIGIGAHTRLLFHAVQEIKSFIKRMYATLRILFPELPKECGQVQIYPESRQKPSTPMSEQMGFLQRQISETDTEDDDREIVSADSLLQPILLPKIFPALFDLYALHCEKDDDKYWERVQKLNKQGDMSLMAYLGVAPQFWCIDNSLFKEEEHKRLSTLKDHCFSNAVDVLQQISTAFCPLDKLEVIKKTFLAITQTVEEFSQEEHVWCMDDLFPIFQFVVVRGKLHHLGAEIHFIEELMESYLEFGELGIMFTTLKACYYQIQNEKIPIH